MRDYEKQEWLEQHYDNDGSAIEGVVWCIIAELLVIAIFSKIFTGEWWPL